MYFEEINAKMKEIRSQNRAYISNMVYSKLEKEKDYSVVCHKSAMAVLNEEKYRTSALFIAADENVIKYSIREKYPPMNGFDVELDKEYIEKIIQLLKNTLY